MAANLSIRRRFQPWQAGVGLGVCAYLLLGAMTHSLRLYHWFLLLLIPTAIFAAERGRRFFIEWMPLFVFWLGYDRLRLAQPYLLGRVTVEMPYQVERFLFGWMFNGAAPPHAARLWLAAHAGEWFAVAISTAAQLIYLSHIFLFPCLMLYWWLRSAFFNASRERFIRHLVAFTILNFAAILCYLLLPVAPPWWVSLYGTAQPTVELVAQTDITQAMDGALVQHMIATAATWFGAVPSLHGAYPVLLWLLARRERSRGVIVLLGLYGAMMWAATVVLNQHYVIDLLAGAALAGAAYLISKHLHNKLFPLIESALRNKQ
jgi:membrane-associated phospholipid phosphatase